MKNLLPVLIFLSVVILLGSCASRRLAKKGAELEESGLIHESADYYYRALLKNEDNVDAKIGLRRTGQNVLDDKLNKFLSDYNNHRTDKAVGKYNEAKDYENKIARVGVRLDFPQKYTDYYKEVKAEHLTKKYREAYKLLREEQFDEASRLFSEIIDLDPEFKDVKELAIEARNEPLYRKAKSAITEEKYRTAYDLFADILSNAGKYKNAEELKAKALEKGTVTIAMLPVKNHTYNRRIAQSIESEMEGQLTRMTNPFLKLIDPDHNKQILKENQSNLTSLSSMNLSELDPEVLKGANALLSCEIISFSAKEGNLKSEDRKGYLKKQYKVKNPETGKKETRTRYKKVRYKEYNKTNQVKCVLSFKLMSVETGEILVSDRISTNLQDKMHFAEFDGDEDKLIPGYWKYKNRKSDQDRKSDNFLARMHLNQLLKGNKKIQSIDYLTEKVIEKGTNLLTRKINAYNPE
ncbi:MAG: hypothetical protein K9J27_10180 [Bacteroidales bacterium]|nr:hypothetical protein [Bacteroidales bacterium]MCF8334947.1 hypothetical protein [Bacteroidales bacterium]